MAEMGADILRRSGLRVMVFGAGRSLDYQHIAKLPSVERVVMSDVVDLRGEADFINITKGTSERFDLIIACEVVEHFPDPMTEFPRLFDLLAKDGLLVCSTNIYDGGNLAKQAYLYLRGHTSYYSPEGNRGDRAPEPDAVRLPGARHRLGAGRPAEALRALHALDPESAEHAEYFGMHPYAPSECELPAGTRPGPPSAPG